MKASIISIGFAYEKGLTIDKSRIYLSKQLFAKGFDINGVYISDEDSYELEFFIKIALDKSDVVFILSPESYDNLVRETISNAIGVPLIFNENWLKKLKSSFPENFSHIKHFARLPYNAKPVDNPYTKALGFIKVLDDVNKAVVFLPENTNSLKVMLETVFEYMHLKDTKFFTKVIRTYGLDINNIKTTLSDFENIYFLQSLEGIDIYLWDSQIEFLENKILVINERLKEYIYGYNEDSIEEIVGRLLKKKNLTLSTAESSTGGLIASRIVNISGSSAYFMGSVVAYSNEVKNKLLGVSKEVLDLKGAVSEEVATQMAKGVCKLLNTNIGISDTGIAGPTGATKDKPLGLHYIGLCFNGDTYTQKVIFKGERNEVRLKVSQHALNMLRQKLLSF